MTKKPRDAGAIVLLTDRDDPKLFWAERSHRSAFLAGYHAFVGGQLEIADSELAGAAASDPDGEAVARVGAVRELFEETGVLVARLERPLGADELEAARKKLMAGSRPFAALLQDLGARHDPELLTPAGRWLTPAFSPRRYDTFFFLAWLPQGQLAAARSAELATGEWIRPAEAVARWREAEVLLAPPVLHILRALAEGFDDGLNERLAETPAKGQSPQRIEFLPGIVQVPLATQTLPPATHTNAFIVGTDRAVLIDPGTGLESELGRLERIIAELVREGVTLHEILLTHHHRDHVAGAGPLSRRLGLPVAAHAETAARLDDGVKVERLIEDGEQLELGNGYALTALHTPGHAPGHLCFLEQRTRALLTADNVVGLGTVIIDPPDGDMDAYLASLGRLAALDTKALFGGHGPALATPRAAIGKLIEHRLRREQAVLSALRSGLEELGPIAAYAYRDTPRAAPELARRQTLAHLERLLRAGLASQQTGRYRIAT